MPDEKRDSTLITVPDGTTGQKSRSSGRGTEPTVETVPITGRLMWDNDPISGIKVTLTYAGDPDGGATASAPLERETDNDGRYSFNATQGRYVEIRFQQPVTYRGRTLVLVNPDLDQVTTVASPETPIQDIIYRPRGCIVSGIVLHAAADGRDGGEELPLSGVAVQLRQDETVIASVTTDEAGKFEILTEKTGHFFIQFEQVERNGVLYAPDRRVFPFVIPPGGLEAFDVPGRLLYRARQRPAETPPATPGQTQASQSAATPTASADHEPHEIEWAVYDEDDEPVRDTLIRVYDPRKRQFVKSGNTGPDGRVRLTVDEPGTYHVYVYSDPTEEPRVQRVPVHSVAPGHTIVPRRPSGGSGGASGASPIPPSGLPPHFGRDFGKAARAVEDAVAFPVLTEEIGYPPSPLARPPGAQAGSAVGSVGQIAMKTISDVLGWQVKDDQKAFLGALNASFPIKIDEGRTVATWMPRSYAVQTDLSGGITGAQASVYSRAKDALDKSLPLLDGLYPLFKEAADEDVTALRATVRTQLTDLVAEFGLVGGPRISRVTQLFLLLLGEQLPTDPSQAQGVTIQADPDKISGSLGNLRVLFGFSTKGDLVNTVADEQNVTNFRIVSDYVTSLAQTWLNNLSFFGLDAQKPFFGTQLVLLSRQLSVIAESVNEVRFTLDSVFIGPAERQTLRIMFKEADKDPDMFLEDLLNWVDQFASEEGPRLIQDGGKFAVGKSFVPIGSRLQHLVEAAQQPVNPPRDIPPGYRTARVRNALRDLAAQLDQLVKLATPINHNITPEPEPSLSVLAVNPNVVSVQAKDPSVLVFGTGFQSDARVTFIPAGAPAPAPRFTGAIVTVLSATTLHVSFSRANLIVGVYDVEVAQDRGGDVQVLGSGLSIVP